MNYVSRIKLKNWRNFRELDVELQDRMFVIGPNASGKSNLLDALRFLRDICLPSGGGLQEAVKQRDDRGGLGKLRCLAARRDNEVELEITLSRWDRDPKKRTELWRYGIGLREQGREKKPVLAYERIWKGGALLKERPDPDDQNDPERLTETLLEQTQANKPYREISRFLAEAGYAHLVPQMVRLSDRLVAPQLFGDPFGMSFMERLARASNSEREKKLGEIEAALRAAVPQLSSLKFVKDQMGRPHLQAKYQHWRPGGAKQQEDQFSDGTLRVIGLFWALLEDYSMLLLEEPELSLNNEIVRELPGLMYEASRGAAKQFIVSTHSYALLSDQGIDPKEVLILKPDPEGTSATLASDDPTIVALIKAGLTIGDAALPSTAPTNVREISLSA